MIETRGLRKQYGTVIALESLDLQIGQGVIFGYVGPNGAGKTTTIRILCGLLAPSGGEARVAGIDVVRRPEQVRSLVGYMPDYLVPYEGMRAWEYLDFFGAAYRIERRRRRMRVDEVLELTQAASLRDYYVETLSHGMWRRLSLARTLMHDPQVLLLDEPTNGLDPRARVELRVLLERLKGMGKTIVISSHILPELASVCDTVGFMERGRLVASGSVRDVQRQVRPHRVIEIETLSDPAAVGAAIRSATDQTRLEILENLLRVQLEATDDELARMLSSLVQAGYSIVGFREVLSDLEEAFLALTSGDGFGRRSVEAL